MSHIVLDAGLASQFNNLAKVTELRDPSERSLGQFIPMSRLAATEPPISEEELQRRRQEPDYSTEEVLAHLKRLLKTVRPTQENGNVTHHR